MSTRLDNKYNCEYVKIGNSFFWFQGDSCTYFLISCSHIMYLEPFQQKVTTYSIICSKLIGSTEPLNAFSQPCFRKKIEMYVTWQRMCMFAIYKYFGRRHNVMHTIDIFKILFLARAARSYVKFNIFIQDFSNEAYVLIHDMILHRNFVATSNIRLMVTPTLFLAHAVLRTAACYFTCEVFHLSSNSWLGS